MTAPELLALLHADPDLAAEVFDQVKIAEAWCRYSSCEWRRYSLAFTGELDDFGKEPPIGRATMLGGPWTAGGVEYPSEDAARAAEDARLTAAGWALAGVSAPLEVQW